MRTAAGNSCGPRLWQKRRLQGGNQVKDTFLTRDRNFYRTLFSLLAVVALQNVIAYSVNMADNIMLGAYRQEALSGAAVVNQFFFIVQQTTIAIGDGLIVISAQYWGQKRTGPIRQVTGLVLKGTIVFGILLILACTFFGDPLLRIFTRDEMILLQAHAYLRIIKFTFLLFMVTQVLLAALRSVETVKIAFLNSCISLVINIVINSTLIYGRFGFPEMGVTGAAIGTITSRTVELLIVLGYLWKKDRKLQLFSEPGLRHIGPELKGDYLKNAKPILIGGVLWSFSIPMQTAILGHLSSDAIAANSVATTFYQYMKVIVVAMSSVSAVTMGKSIGVGNLTRVKSDARSLAVIDICIGTALGAVLFLTRKPLLSHYALNPSAALLAEQLIVIMSLVMVGMSYQMPVSGGVLRGSGDAKFTMRLNLISTWLIVTPLSFAAAFWWKWPIPAVVICLQSDQIFKCLPVFLRFRSYKWIHKLTREKISSGE